MAAVAAIAVAVPATGAKRSTRAVKLPQKSADELLSEGRDAFMNYDFEKASELYSEAKRKAKGSDSLFNANYEMFRHQLTEAENFMGRVENIVIIDSITVPRENFFKAYRIPASSGSLRGTEALPFKSDMGVDYVFTNEGQDYKLWAQPDSTGYMRLVETTLLTDGSWSEPSQLSDELFGDSDALYPFMMADGVTLYYADNGDDSIGGYDIMVATRDPSDGTFLQPSNLGFPYNSPYDDYLLAIDELNGVGWWATDRNQLDDELTVYVFITNDLRKNYPADDDNITGKARIDDYISTQPEDSNYDELLATIREINPEHRVKKSEFTFPTSGGVIYHNYDELPTAAARAAMKRYRQAAAELEKSEATLAAKRMEYHHARSSSLASRIAQSEKMIESQRREVARLLSDLHKLLRQN